MDSQHEDLAGGKRRLVITRMTLSLVLAVLLGLSLSLQNANREVALANGKHNLESPSVSQSGSTPTNSSSTTPSSTPTTQPTTPAALAALQLIQDHQKAAGCAFNSSPTASTKSLGTCKILLIGDSLGNNLGYGMKGQISYKHSLKFVLRAKASTGLSNSWFYNWPNNLKTMLKYDKPNLVVVFLGANDRQNMKVDGKILTFGTTSWKRAYAASITKVTNLATAAGSYVLWVGLPIMKPFNYNAGMAVITSLYAKSVPAVAGGSTVAIWNYFADSRGNYRAYARVNGVNTKVRGTDGIHFTQVGQNVVATYVIKKIASIYHVNLTSSSPRIMSR